MMRRLLAAAMLTLAAAGGAGEARGDVIFSNLGPGDNFDPLNTQFLGGLQSSTGQAFGVGVIAAMPFTVPVGMDVVFARAELALFHLEGPTGLDVRLAADAAGLPGVVLESIPVSLPPSPALVAAESSGLPVLAAGATYWIIASLDLAGTAAGGWHYVTPAADGLVALQVDDGGGPSGWFASTGPALAFRVTGIAAVPEPPTLALAGPALMAGLAVWRWRRRSEARAA